MQNNKNMFSTNEIFNVNQNQSKNSNRKKAVAGTALKTKEGEIITWKDGYFGVTQDINEKRGPKIAYRCSECFIFFNTRLSFFTHSQMHLKPFCILCGLYTKSKEELACHMKTHHRQYIEIVKTTIRKPKSVVGDKIKNLSNNVQTKYIETNFYYNLMKSIPNTSQLSSNVLKPIAEIKKKVIKNPSGPIIVSNLKNNSEKILALKNTSPLLSNTNYIVPLAHNTPPLNVNPSNQVKQQFVQFQQQFIQNILAQNLLRSNLLIQQISNINENRKIQNLIEEVPNEVSQLAALKASHEIPREISQKKSFGTSEVKKNQNIYSDSTCKFLNKGKQTAEVVMKTNCEQSKEEERIEEKRPKKVKRKLVADDKTLDEPSKKTVFSRSGRCITMKTFDF